MRLSKLWERTARTSRRWSFPPAFVGLSLIKQHQMVYDALGDRMREEIHALSLRTLTPEQAQQLRHPAVH